VAHSGALLEITTERKSLSPSDPGTERRETDE